MVAVLRKDIMRLMMTVSCQGFGCTGEVCANSRGEKGQCMVPKRLEKVWVGGSVNFRILTLVRRTHALIIGNSQSNRRFTKRQVPRGGVYAGLVILAHPRLMVSECTLIFEPSDRKSTRLNSSHVALSRM